MGAEVEKKKEYAWEGIFKILLCLFLFELSPPELVQGSLFMALLRTFLPLILVFSFFLSGSELFPSSFRGPSVPGFP